MTSAKELAAALAKILPVGDDRAPGDRVIPIYVRMDELRALRCLASAATAKSDEMPERYRHRKRGTEYEVIATAQLQDARGDRVPEGDLLVIYRGDDGRCWARRWSEFGDGRFERLNP